MLKSGEGILDEGVSKGYNRKLSGSTEKSLQEWYRHLVGNWQERGETTCVDWCHASGFGL